MATNLIHPATKTRSVPKIPAIWPFTQPLTDIKIYLYTLPALWILGLEQVIPYIIIFWAGIKCLLIYPRVRVPAALRLAIIFIAWQLFSFTSIDIATNVVVFAKNFLTYLAGWLLVFILVNTLSTLQQVRDLLRPVVTLTWIFTGIGLFFAVGLLPSNFSSPAGLLLPGVLKGSEFVQNNILVREIGRLAAEFGPITINRISSIFLFPTDASLAYLIILPLLFYLLITTPKTSKRISLLVLLVLGFLAFLLTATRTSLLSLLLASFSFATYLFIRRFPKLTIPAILFFLIVLAISLLILFAPLIQELYQALFVNIRGDSLVSRFEVYAATLESWLEKPITGWGTPREIETVRLAPAGTHSEYFFVLYSYGLIGLILFMGFLLSTWRRLLKNLNDAKKTSRTEYLFFVTIGISLLGININSLTQSSKFDFTIAMLTWMNFGFANLQLLKSAFHRTSVTDTLPAEFDHGT